MLIAQVDIEEDKIITIFVWNFVSAIPDEIYGDYDGGKICF